jgi:hypothetical protein
MSMMSKPVVFSQLTLRSSPKIVRFLCLYWLLLPAIGQAEPATKPVVRKSPGAAATGGAATQEAAERPISGKLPRIIKLWNQGDFDELITLANRELAGSETPNPDVTYWRAYANWKLGRLDEAYKDFASLGDFDRWGKLGNASKLAAQMRDAIALRPAREHPVTVGEKTAFKVYYSEKTAFVEAVLEALPQGYQLGTELLHKEVAEIPVFIFDEAEYESFVEFMGRFATDPGKRAHFMSVNGSIIISQRNRVGDVVEPDIDTLPETITHEMTHVLMRRVLGKIKDLPNWFTEGSAEMTAAARTPARHQLNDKRVKRLLADGAILPLEQLKSHGSFHDAVEQRGDGLSKASPYAQGMSMTRYLGYLLKGVKFADFLALTRKRRSFEVALTESTGMTVDQFFDSWLFRVQRQ